MNWLKPSNLVEFGMCLIVLSPLIYLIYKLTTIIGVVIFIWAFAKEIEENEEKRKKELSQEKRF